MTLPQPPQEPITIGKYQILELAGEGAMGSVYRARDTVLGRTVAIKVMNATIARDQSLRDRFLREAQSAGSLQHPNVVTIFDFGEVDGHLFIAMEYVDGSDLETLLTKPGSLTLQARLEIMIDVLAGLEYAHQHGIVHRDLKPANIRVTSEPRGKLMDFGVAHLESQKLTQTGVMIGTPNYMAPEYISGKPVTAASDIFSMGAVLYEVLTGRKPFQGDTLHALLFAVVQEEPPAPSSLAPGLPSSLDAVVQKAMAKDPEHRYRSAIEMAHALTSIRASLSGPSYNDSAALSTTLAYKVAAKGADAAREAAARAAASPAPKAKAAPGRSVARSVGVGVAAVAVLAVGGIALTRDKASGDTPSEVMSDAVDASGAASRDEGAASAGTDASPASLVSDATPAVPSPAKDAPAQSAPSTPAPAAPAPVASKPTATLPTSAAAPGTAKSPATQTPAAGSSGSTGSAAVASASPASASPASPAPVSPTPVNTAPGAVSVPSAPAPAPSTATTSDGSTAVVPTTTTPSAAATTNALRESITRYARAISARDINAVRSAYPGISRDQQQGFERFFGSTKSLQATLILSSVDVRDRAAEGRVSGTYEFETSGGRRELQVVSFRAQFERDGDTWRLMSVR